MLQMALPGLPIGSEPQKKVLEAIKSLSAVIPATAEVPGVAMTQLAGLQKQAQESAMLSQLAGAMGQGPNIQPVGPQ